MRLIDILEQSEHRNEVRLQENQELEAKIPRVDYMSGFAYRVLARQNDSLALLLKPDNVAKEVNAKAFSKLRAKDKVIGKFMDQMEQVISPVTALDKTHFVHADPAVWNFVSKREEKDGKLEDRVMLTDWERSHVAAQPQFSLWTLLWSTIPNPTERAEDLDDFLEHAYKVRYNVRDISDLNQGDFEQFKDNYHRMDTYHSVINITRQLGWRRQALSGDENEKAAAFTEIAVQHYHHAKQLFVKLGAAEAIESLDKLIQYTFPEEDIKVLGLDDANFYRKQVKQLLGRRDFEIAAAKEEERQKKAARRKGIFKRLGSALLPLSIVAAAGLVYSGLTGNVDSNTTLYEKGTEITESSGYFFADDAPFTIAENGVQFEINNSQRTLEILLDLEQDKKLGPQEITTYVIRDGERYELQTSWGTNLTRRKNLENKGGTLNKEFDIPNWLDDGAWDVYVEVRDFDQVHFAKTFEDVVLSSPISPEEEERNNFAKCVYDTVKLGRLDVFPTTVSPGDAIVVDVELYADYDALESPCLPDSLTGIMILGDGTKIEKEMQIAAGFSTNLGDLSLGNASSKSYFPTNPFSFKLNSLPSYSLGDVDLYIRAETRGRFNREEQEAVLWYGSRNLSLDSVEDFPREGLYLDVLDVSRFDSLPKLDEWESSSDTQVTCAVGTETQGEAGSEQDSNIECFSIYGPSVDLAQFRYVIHTNEGVILSDQFSIQDIPASARHLLEQSVEYIEASIEERIEMEDEMKQETLTTAFPLKVPDSLADGVYPFTIEYKVDDEFLTFGIAYEGFIEVGKEKPAPQPFSKFVHHAIENPETVTCTFESDYNNENTSFVDSEQLGSRSSFPCVTMLNYLEDLSGGEVHFNYNSSIEHQRQMRVSSNDRSTQILVGSCEDFSHLLDLDANSNIAEHFGILDTEGWEAPFNHPAGLELRVAKSYRTGDRNFLFLCSDRLTKYDLARTLVNFDIENSDHTVLRIQGDNAEIE